LETFDGTVPKLHLANVTIRRLRYLSNQSEHLCHLAAYGADQQSEVVTQISRNGTPVMIFKRHTCADTKCR